MFREVMRWKSDDMPESTPAIVVVSSEGIVKRLEYKRWNCKNLSYSTIKEKIYKLTKNRGTNTNRKKSDNWYLSVKIGRKSYSIHRLVAMAWLPNPYNKKEVNHINGIKYDNRVENLEWATRNENMHHAKISGLYNREIKIKNSQVEEMKKMRLDGMKLKNIGFFFGVTGECVRHRTSKTMTSDEINLCRQSNNRWKNNHV